MNITESVSLADIPFAVLCTDLNGIIIDCNMQFSCLSGYSHAQLIGEPVELLLPDSMASVHVEHRQLYQGNASVINHPRHSLLLNQSEQSIPCTIRVQEQEHGYIVFLTEYLEAASFDHDPSTKDVKKVLGSIEEAFWEWNIEKNIMFYSAHMMAILDYGEEAYTGPATLGKEMVTRDVLKNIYSMFDEHLSGRTPCVNITFPIKTKYGITKWLSIVGKIFSYKDNKPHKVFGSVKDITENYQLVDRLKEKNNYLVLAEDLINSGHWRYDLFTQELFWSTGVYRIHGLDPSNYKPTINSATKLYIEEQQSLINQKMANAVK